MARRPHVPEQVRLGPFAVEEASRAGVTRKMLIGKSYVRLFPRVWVWIEHSMTHLDWIRAAQLAMPKHARMTGITRIQALGLRYGSKRPLHFVVAGDLHIAIDDVFLHRTERLPPGDEVGVTPAAAFIAFCACSRVVDAIKVGDWLLHHKHMTVLELRELAFRDRWRSGARQALWISRYLDGRARSLPESETRAQLVFAGLPAPDVNAEVVVGSEVLACVDLLYRRWRTAVEYEGGQHQLTRDQYLVDIGRYAAFRDLRLDYVQVTKESLRRARSMVSEVYRLVANGYDGPAPTFGAHYHSLFALIPTDRHIWGGGSVPLRAPRGGTDSPPREAIGN